MNDFDSKLLECPICDNHFTYEEWQVEEACPLCKHADGWNITNRDLRLADEKLKREKREERIKDLNEKAEKAEFERLTKKFTLQA